MKAGKFLVLLVLLLAGSSGAWAQHHGHGGRAHVGVYFGPYWGTPWYYPPPVYYPPQVVVVPAAPPPVYVEQNPAPAAPAPAQSSWYYCRGAKGYYPYVKECPEGWQQVLPQPER